MRRRVHKSVWALIVVFAMVCLLTACGGGEITLDSNGVASWEPVKKAVQYECCIVDSEYIIQETIYTTETSIQIPEGVSVHVRAVLPNGKFGDWMVSEYYGTNTAFVDPSEDIMQYVDRMYDLKWEDLQTYEVISNINYDSVKTLDNGSVFFEAVGPKGEVMRFEGRNVTVTEGAITFEPNGRIAALDAIGRICAVDPVVAAPGNPANFVKFTGGFTFTDAVSVNSAEDLFYIWGFGNTSEEYSREDLEPSSHMDYQPNFIAFGASADNIDAFSISELTVYYDEMTFHTGIRMLALEYGFYGSYLEGEYYNPSKEVYNSAERIYDFYLLALPDVANERVRYEPDPLTDEIISRCLLDFDDSRFVIGDVRDANGTVLDKQNAKLSVGSTVDVTLGNYTMAVQLPVLERYGGAQTLHELSPYSNANGTGEVTSLVIPIFWQDQQEYATDEMLATLRSSLGRVMDANGTVTDYSDGLTDRFSLSEYYDIASYGKHTITSYITDWYAAPHNFVDEMEDTSADGPQMIIEVSRWLYMTYPEMDWSRFDRNGDGFFDSVILVNTGVDNDDEMLMATYSHAVHVSPGYTGENAGLQSRPKVKNYISMNASFLSDMTLIHEYAHGFGLIDYYDVTYSGIDAVGSYDMQSGSYGDWNVYSKYAAGWIEPEIVQGLAEGEFVEISIGSFAKTGDAIVIPAADTAFDGPFGEYMLLDLFTDDGVNVYDAPGFELTDAVGVRIYHVNAAMEKRVLKGSDGVGYPIGTPHTGNAYTADGKYHIELLQAGRKNTFTDVNQLRTCLTEADLFTTGDVFTAERYSEFLTDGRMDDGSEFGYKVEIAEIATDANGDATATIRVTRQ